MHACTLSRVRRCGPTDCSPPGSPVHGISRARILERVAISSSEGSSLPRGPTCISSVSCIGRWILLPLCHQGKSHLRAEYQSNVTWFSIAAVSTKKKNK